MPDPRRPGYVDLPRDHAGRVRRPPASNEAWEREAQQRLAQSRERRAQRHSRLWWVESALCVIVVVLVITLVVLAIVGGLKTWA